MKTQVIEHSWGFHVLNSISIADKHCTPPPLVEHTNAYFDDKVIYQCIPGHTFSDEETVKTFNCTLGLWQLEDLSPCTGMF